MPRAEGTSGSGAQRGPAGLTHLCREDSTLRWFCGVRLTSTPSTLLTALSTAKSFSPEAAARMYQDPRNFDGGGAGEEPVSTAPARPHPLGAQGPTRSGLARGEPGPP